MVLSGNAGVVPESPAFFIAATCLLVEIAALRSIVSLAYISLILVAESIFVCSFRFLFVSSVCGGSSLPGALGEPHLFSALPHPGSPRCRPRQSAALLPPLCLI